MIYSISRFVAMTLFVLCLFAVSLLLILPGNYLPQFPSATTIDDKIVHCVVFFVMTLLFIYGFLPPKRWMRQGQIVILVFTIYAGLTEFLQIFTKRQPDFYDFFANFIGIILAWSALRIFFHVHRYRKKQQKLCLPPTEEQ